MKNIKKIGAVMLSTGILLSAMPLLPVCAEDAATATEAMTAKITLSETSATATGSNVKIEGTKITISASGSYEFTGKLNDGQIVVNVEDTTLDKETVKLFFNNVDITGLTAAPVYVVNAKNTSINLMDGTVNTLTDGEKYGTDTTAVIYAKDDITIKSGGTEGTGKLKIVANYQQGIHCSNDLKITGGDIDVKAELADGVRGKESVEIKGGKLDVNAGGDGVKSTKGYVLISGGDTEIKAGNDAVQGEANVTDSKTNEVHKGISITGGSLKANGDRALTNVAGEAEITGGVVFATATKDTVKEGQTEQKDNTIKVSASAQPILMFNTTEQQVKDQRVELKNAGADTVVFSKNPNKKYDYVLISSPELKAGSKYDLYIGGVKTEPAEIAIGAGITTVKDIVSKVEVAVPEIDPLDINADGFVDVSDAVMLARFLAEDKTVKLADGAINRVDTNSDGKNNGDDVITILRHIAHLD
ncbi:MAG: carbohydrate-binding domain-containing protein [Oscillospiraceae bacterium]|nr:carbohydrate-binding domain-containing protein [Oscillospiraceae bacterium]